MKVDAKVKAFVRFGGSVGRLRGIGGSVKVLYGDVTDVTSLLEAMTGVDYVFNAAAVVPIAETRAAPQSTVMVNALGAYNVAYAAIKSHVRKMLQVSTCHIYGNQPEGNLPLKETATPLPLDIYSSSKYSAEILLQAPIHEGAPIVITRAFAKFGAYQKPNFLIPTIMGSLLKGEPPALGSPEPTRDYSYVTDIVHGYMLALEKGRPGEIYHFSSGKERSVREIYDAIAASIGSGLKPVWRASSRSGDIMRQVGDSSKARAELGWRPTIGFEEGISMTVDWMKSSASTYA